MWTTYFDLDDTLTPTQPFYEEAKDRFAAETIALTGADMTLDDVKTVIDEEVDDALYRQHGVTADRFKNALYATAGILLERTGTDPHDYDFDLPEEWGMYPVEGYTPETMMPGATAALDTALEHGDHTAVLTKGAPETQHPKIDALNLRDTVDAVHVVGDKGDWFTANLVDDGTAYLKVGNSVKSDIVPALEADEQLDDAILVGLHVPEETWAGEETETVLDEDYADAPWMRIPDLTRFDEAFTTFQDYARTGDITAVQRLRD